MSGSKWGFGMMMRMRKRALGRKKIEKNIHGKREKEE